MRRLLVAVVVMLAAPSVHAEAAPARVRYRELSRMLKRFERQAEARARASALPRVLAAR
jgi:hypothetical protein